MSDSALIIDREPKGLRIALGVICLILGLVALIWPQATLFVVAIVFGLQLIAVGLIRVFAAIALKESAGWWRAVSGILGGLTVIAGIICFFRPNASLLLLALILAIGWIIDGISELVSAFAVPHSAGRRIGMIAWAVVSIIAAIVVLVFPGESLVLLARIGGVVLLAFGVLALIAAFVGGRQEGRAEASTTAGSA